MNNRRLYFIDCARTYAVFLALLSHLLITTRFFNDLGSDAIYVKQFTRMATPMFVFMFGFMIEFVYVRRVINNGHQLLRQRLHIRAFQCYFAYSLTGFCGFLGGFTSFQDFMLSLVFLSDSRFGNILRVYAVILLFTPLIIQLRVHYPNRFLIIALSILLASFPVTSALKASDFGAMNNAMNTLFGIGPVKAGPSVWHSLCFVFAGMLMASSFNTARSTRNDINSRFYFNAFGLVITCLLAWYFLIDKSFSVGWWSFVDMSYRKDNAAGYFIIGTLTSVITFIFFKLWIGTRTPPFLFQLLLPIGLSSLFSYTVGNCLLNLFGIEVIAYPLLTAILFFPLLVFITRYITLLPGYQMINDLLNLRLPNSTAKASQA
ncbi:OpgC domain-containing protein [Parahaliea sp. F7430]|uniref:OpgC domain-containing protein n=1 Tax=Sediminihaliea albiluteola TaxID=2758564 RepID=A0A7W2YI91_9GAMM|nr:OpgC domain-containing protein [Sediminihaliea albiluteola]MBA6411787.1 OpgC domain-containing protein [Sediminihaliea albiluteola]